MGPKGAKKNPEKSYLLWLQKIAAMETLGSPIGGPQAPPHSHFEGIVTVPKTFLKGSMAAIFCSHKE